MTTPASTNCNGVYTVHAVDAGDRFTLVRVEDGQPKFKDVMLSFVQCRKLGRRLKEGGMSEDEPCAADAMEFTRSLCIGKQVAYVEHEYVAPLERGAGSLQLQSGEVIAEALLKAGLATVAPRPGACPKPRWDELSAIQAKAKAQRKGVFAPDAADRVRIVGSHPPPQLDRWAQAMKGRPLKVRVDRVVTGSMLVLAAVDDMDWQLLNANFTGITAKRTDANALRHTERFLLHRAVNLEVDGVDSFGNVLVTLKGPKGTFQSDLLSRGLCKIAAATLDRTAHRSELVAAERVAKEKKLGVWEHEGQAAAAGGAAGGVTTVNADGITVATAPTATTGGKSDEPQGVEWPGETEFNATVVQVVTGDLLLVKHAESGEYLRISLAGVRGQRMVKRDNDKQQGERPPESRVSYEDYTWEGREFLRTRYIGKGVTVRVEYARAIAETKEIRAMATVICPADGCNIGVELLKAGLAKFFLGRNDECSTCDLMLAAEDAAKAAKVGIHSGEPSPTTKMTELNRCGERQAKYYLTFLQRGMSGKRPPTWRAVVDACMGGSAFRVYVPREHLIFTLRLAGVVSPSSGGFNGEPADPLASESKDFAVMRLQQREVDIMVETVDRGGNFIGYLNFDGGKSFAAALLAEGLATCSGSERTLNGGELQSAQRRAQEEEKGIWALGSGAIPAAAKRREAQMAERNKPKATFVRATAAEEQWIKVNVTDVSEACGVSIVPLNKETEAKRAELAELLSTFASSAAKSHQPRRNERVAVLFKEDMSWNRGTVLDVDATDKTASVRFDDFGTVLDAQFKTIRAIPADSGFDALRNVPPLAEAVPLAFVKEYSTGADAADAAEGAVDRGWEYVEGTGATLMARVEYTSEGGKRRFYTISKTEGGSTLQEALLRDGHVLVDREAVTVEPPAATRFVKAQEAARTAHSGIWRFGDVDDDSDEEN